MVFSSELFLFWFLPPVLGVYAYAGRFRHAWLMLVSLLFYGWANPLFVPLMLGSTMLDYLVGRVMVFGRPWEGSELALLKEGGSRTFVQKAALWTSILVNLGLLGFFKYFNFGVDSFGVAAAQLGLPAVPPSWVIEVTLPIGISFYTFQSMSYGIDVYRGHARPVRSFVDFGCYVTMFPQLVAGPIIRFSEVSKQLASRVHSLPKVAAGTALFSLGLGKKVLLANPAGQLADLVFDARAVGTLEAWLGTYAYAMQIYFDFSGYSDMAIGLGLILGFSFPKNFDAPYRSASITEFWRRWHISLSSFLRDYLYIPLGGNKKGSRRTYVNLAIVMLLGGLWHGAAWNFVIWGGIHGCMLAFERSRGKASLYHRLPRPIGVAFTFTLVCIAWVFFRAPTVGEATSHLATMAGFGVADPALPAIATLARSPFHLGALALGSLVVWGAPWQTWDFSRVLSAPRAIAVFTVLLASVLVLSAQSYNPFIYFQF